MQAIDEPLGNLIGRLWRDAFFEDFDSLDDSRSGNEIVASNEPTKSINLRSEDVVKVLYFVL